jgi:hypothetical protein
MKYLAFLLFLLIPGCAIMQGIIDEAGKHPGEEFGPWGCFESVEVRSCAVVRITCE